MTSTFDVKSNNDVGSQSEINCYHANSRDSESPYRFLNCAHKDANRSIHIIVMASTIVCVSHEYHLRYLYFQMFSTN